MFLTRPNGALLYLGIFLLVSIGQAQGQIVEILDYSRRKAVADSLVEVLHEGVLVVRLKSYRNNLKAIDQSLASSKLSNKDKKRLEDQRQSIIAERDSFNQELIEAFQTEYEYSPFLILYDTAIHHLRKGVQSGFFLTADRTVDSTISLSNRPFMVIGQGRSNGSQGLLIYNAQMKPIAPPFPAFHETRDLGKSFLFFFKRKNNNGRKRIAKIIAKLNRQLDKYLQQVLEEKERKAQEAALNEERKQKKAEKARKKEQKEENN